MCRSPQNVVTIPQNMAVVGAMASYRCRTRPNDQGCAVDCDLDSWIQLKAPNAVEAFRLARLVTNSGFVEIEVERLDG